MFVICQNCYRCFSDKNSYCPYCHETSFRSKMLTRYLYSRKRRNLLIEPKVFANRYLLSIRSANKIIEVFNTNYNKVGFEDKSSKSVDGLFKNDARLDECPDVANAFIESVIVEDLFGYLTYSLSFEKELSIILAPNGFGKTTIFNIIAFLLNPDIHFYSQYISTVPFKSIKILLRDKKQIVFTKSYNQESSERDSLSLHYIIISENSTILSDIVCNNAEFLLPSFFSENKKHNIYDGEYQIDEIETKLERFEKSQYYESSFDSMLLSLKEAKVFPSLFFIRTNRSDPFITDTINSHVFSSKNNSNETEYLSNAIESCESELDKLILDSKYQYQELIESVKNNLAIKFLEAKTSTINYNEYKENLSLYCEKINQLIDFGLLKEEDKNGLDILNLLSKEEYDNEEISKGTFASLYVTEYLKTLEPLEKLCKRMSNFQSIINQMNDGTNKCVKFSSSGMEYYNNNQRIQLSCLSSGEKNDFIMFFYLVFRVKKNSLILIDEPEISLHIDWQEMFIENIYKAIDDKECQVVISTHSPFIISRFGENTISPIMEHNEYDR